MRTTWKCLYYPKLADIGWMDVRGHLAPWPWCARCRECAHGMCEGGDCRCRCTERGVTSSPGVRRTVAAASNRQGT